jgi:hypothetical protein
MACILLAVDVYGLILRRYIFRGNFPLAIDVFGTILRRLLALNVNVQILRRWNIFK